MVDPIRARLRDLDGRFLVALLTVTLVALASRLTYLSIRSPTDGPDSHQYKTIAENIRAHHSFSLDSSAPFGPTIRRAPLYPLFLALAGGSETSTSGDRARIWQCVLDSLVAAMVCVILHGLVRLRWSVAAGMTYAFHPAAMLYASSILSESLFTFLATLAVAALLFGARRDRLSWTFAAGLLFGSAALARPIAAPLVLVVAAMTWWSRKSIRRPHVMALVFSVASLLPITPWIIRSSALAGRFVLISATGPVNLALGTAAARWNLNDQSTIWENSHYWQTDPCGRAIAAARTPAESARADRVCLNTALSSLREHPREYLRNRMAQVGHFPLTSFDTATGNSTSLGAALEQRAWKTLGMKLGLLALFSLVPLLAGIIGLFRGGEGIEKTLCGGLWVSTILILLPGYVEYRYFFPAVPMLLVTAALALDWLSD